LEKAFQTALMEFKESRVKEIMKKEWEKIQRLTYFNIDRHGQ
jgi:hypothetical protein